MQEQDKKELISSMRRKRLKKYALTALALLIVVSVAVGFKLEDRNAKLPDGQGEIVVNTDQTGENLDAQDGSGDADDAAQAGGSDADAKGQDGSETAGGDTDKPADKGKSQAGTGKEKTKPTKKYTEAEKKKLDAKDIKVDNKDDFTASNDGNRALKPEVPEKVTVTLEIRCDTLSRDMDRLENPAIKDYIPTDGVILKTSTYKGTTDNTVFDALNTLCRNNDIQLDFSYTPMFESNYIKGINYLYEFDGVVRRAGWMYKVNDWFPNYGCSSYYLRDGDGIVSGATPVRDWVRTSARTSGWADGVRSAEKAGSLYASMPWILRRKVWKSERFGKENA